MTQPSEVIRWSIRGIGVALGALVVACLAVGVVLAWRVAVIVFISILLGTAIEPVVTYGRDRLPIPRGIAILVLYAALAAVVVGVVVLVLPGALAEADSITGRLPERLDSLEAWAANLQPAVLASTVASLADAARASLLQARPPRAEDVVDVGLTVAEAGVTIVTIFALIYFWVTERARLQRYATAFLPFERRAGFRDTWNDVEVRLGGWVRGQLILMGTVALATGSAYWLLGLPSALLLGLIAGLAELIPLVGPALGAIPALVVAAALRPDLVIPVLIVYLVIQLIEGNFLVPVVMRGSVGISPFVVLVSLLVGGAIGGIVGALIAIPLAAIVLVILERLQAREIPVTLDPTATTEDRPEARDSSAADEVLDSPAAVGRIGS
ncbi:MAG TPA: AI-2E family transporter [Candidatus Saccharimonadia bacterium]|nr:AI-2E family transporter [Candidatus Saccharimonadia bacterium]